MMSLGGLSVAAAPGMASGQLSHVLVQPYVMVPAMQQVMEWGAGCTGFGQ